MKFLALNADGESVKNHADDDRVAQSAGDEPGDDMDLSSDTNADIEHGSCNNAHSPQSLSHSFAKFLSGNNAVEVAKDDSALDGFFLYRDKFLQTTPILRIKNRFCAGIETKSWAIIWTLLCFRRIITFGRICWRD